MKELYTKPMAEVSEFAATEILTASAPIENIEVPLD